MRPVASETKIASPVARRGELSVNEVAADFDVAPETVRRWMRQADVDDGVKDGLTSSEQSEIVQLRRTSRRLEAVGAVTAVLPLCTTRKGDRGA